MNESKNEMLGEVSKIKFILNLRYTWKKNKNKIEVYYLML